MAGPHEQFSFEHGSEEHWERMGGQRMGGYRSRGGGLPGGGMRPDDLEELEEAERAASSLEGLTSMGMYVIGVMVGVYGSYMLAQALPYYIYHLVDAARQERATFEKAALLAIAFVALPVAIAQIGLLGAPLLPPLVGWKVFVYGSAFSGGAAAFLGALTLLRSETRPGTTMRVKNRALFATTVGVVVLGLVWASTRVAEEHAGRPALNDLTTDSHEPPVFELLADANHPGGYPAHNLQLLREFYDELRPKSTFLPIGAALIRSLKIAEEKGWKVVTHIDRDPQTGSVSPSAWMDKDEIIIEATSTEHAPLFLIPDEIVIRIRTELMDESSYAGSRVDVRSRGHRANDHGSNFRRVRDFLDALNN
jgi:hypothetical protein